MKNTHCDLVLFGFLFHLFMVKILVHCTQFILIMDFSKKKNRHHIVTTQIMKLILTITIIRECLHTFVNIFYNILFICMRNVNKSPHRTINMSPMRIIASVCDYMRLALFTQVAHAIPND